MIEVAVVSILTIGVYMSTYRVYMYLLIITDLYYWLDKFKSPSRGVYTVNWTIKELIALYNIDNANRWYICRTRLSKNIVVSLLCAMGIFQLVCVEFTRKTDGAIVTSYLLVNSFSSYGNYCDRIDLHIYEFIKRNNKRLFSVSKIIKT